MQDEFGNASTAPTGGARVGFCQDCGKPLTQETVRMVGSGVFCEPCLERRVGAAGPAAGAAPYGVPPVGAAPVPGYSVPPPPAHAPSPMLAGFLGMIPGVGAMYNEQYAKGLAHFAIFAVLMSLSDGHSLFGLMAFGWYCYQIFDAYHTAKARLEGRPLPNPFGLNDIGERMGFGKNWPGSAARPTTTATTPPPPPPASWASVPAVPPVAPQPPVPPANWAGYVPPSAFAMPPAVPPPAPAPVAQAGPAASFGASPYQAPYQVPYTPVPTPVPVGTAPVAAPHAKKFPAGAIWLIGLGLLFLVANLDPQFHLSALWSTAAILGALAIWIVLHRIWQLRRLHPEGVPAADVVVCLLRWPPVVLLTLAVLFALQAANLYTIGQTWGALFIAFGASLLAERLLARAVYVAPMAVEPPVPPAPTWTAESTPPVAADATKDGQL